MFAGGIVTLKVKTTDLPRFACPERAVPPPRERMTLVHARRLTVGSYRFR
jgi:hypothetical protein